jgi:hypothetical protein
VGLHDIRGSVQEIFTESIKISLRMIFRGESKDDFQRGESGD